MTVFPYSITIFVNVDTFLPHLKTYLRVRMCVCMCMCVCMSVCVRVCLCLCMCVNVFCVFVDVWLCLCTHVCMRAYMCVYACVRVCVCLCLCVCLSVFVWVCVCVFVYISSKACSVHAHVCFLCRNMCLNMRMLAELIYTMFKFYPKSFQFLIFELFLGILSYKG